MTSKQNLTIVTESSQAVSKSCKEDSCGSPVSCRGWCKKHYTRWLKTGDPQKTLKAEAGSWIKCAANCNAQAKYKGYCQKHYRRIQNTGSPDKTLATPPGEGQPYIDSRGYRVIPNRKDHPNSWGNGRIAEHVLVMSKMLDRPLFLGENVHHKNGVRDDNRPENLELWVTTQPAGQRPEELLEWADEIVRRYRVNG